MTPGTTTNSRPQLEIHVFNAGVGESIVLRMPNGRWGVVDSYAVSIDDPGTNPALSFLRQHGIDSLDFLCLTHAHADHFRGMKQILESMTFVPFGDLGHSPEMNCGSPQS